VYSEATIRPELTLEAGKYQVSLYYKEQLLAEQTIKVESGMSRDVVLLVQGGKLVLKAQRQEGSDLITENVSYWIRDAEGKRVKNKTIPQYSTNLLPGHYQLEASFQRIKRTHNIEIKAGETVEHTFVMGGMGQLSITAKETENGEPINISFQIRTEDGKHVSTKTTKQWRDELSAGKYLLQARYFRQEASAEVEVKPDEKTTYQFILGERGLLRLTTVDKAGNTQGVTYQVRRKADGQNMSSRKEKVWERRLLPAVYSVSVSTLWQGELQNIEREYEVKPGETVEETFTLPFAEEGAVQ
jgi:hypothetical protein